MHPQILRIGLLISVSLYFMGCSTLPPGSDYPKQRSVMTLAPDATRLGQRIESATRQHAGQSGFRMISVGVDGFLMRLEAINAAERTLDLQYYIFHGDESGRLLTEALVRAADRGVQVRILVDDGETEAGDEQVFTLHAHSNIEIRVYNPWAYRGHRKMLRRLEFLLHHSRLDYRMHNKLLVADNTVALVGGRNIGDQYFQIDPESQFADDDVFVAGPLVPQLSGTFDEFWNSTLAIPTAAFARPGSIAQSRPAAHQEMIRKAGFDYEGKLARGQPFDDLVSGKTSLVWAAALVACDSPEKKKVLEGERAGSLMYQSVAQAIGQARTELLMITPYLIPSRGELNLLDERQAQGARVAILTNSLESAPDLSAHSGYAHYRKPLLLHGIELYEVRAQLDSVRGSGQSARISSYGTYALHGKLLVFDRSRVYIGSMNFDRRSHHLNTEIGLIIDSPELSQQVAARFRSMTQPESAYAVALQPASSTRSARLVWRTREGDLDTELTSEPARSHWQKFKVHLLSLLPLDGEL